MLSKLFGSKFTGLLPEPAMSSTLPLLRTTVCIARTPFFLAMPAPSPGSPSSA